MVRLPHLTTAPRKNDVSDLTKKKTECSNKKGSATLKKMEGCLIPGDAFSPVTLCTLDDFCKMSCSDLFQLSTDLPEGFDEGAEYSMYVQQNKQDSRLYYANTRASKMTRQTIYADVLLVSKESLTLMEWIAFVNRRFPRETIEEKKAELSQKQSDSCTIQ